MERLVLHIEVPEFNVDGTQEAADEWNDGNILPIVTEEWMRDDVIVVARPRTLVKREQREARKR
jgi:hypothetical protein